MLVKADLFGMVYIWYIFGLIGMEIAWGHVPCVSWTMGSRPPMCNILCVIGSVFMAVCLGKYISFWRWLS